MASRDTHSRRVDVLRLLATGPASQSDIDRTLAGDYRRIVDMLRAQSQVRQVGWRRRARLWVSTPKGQSWLAWTNPRLGRIPHSPEPSRRRRVNGKPPDYVALTDPQVLAALDGSAQSDVAKALGIKSPTLYVRLRRLESEGRVFRALERPAVWLEVGRGEVCGRCLGKGVVLP